MRLRFWRRRKPKGYTFSNVQVTDKYEPVRQINITLIAYGEMISKLGERVSELQTRIRVQELELRELKKQVKTFEKGKSK